MNVHKGELVKKITPPEYQTSDLFESAYLQYKGYDRVKIQRIDEKAYFIFMPRPTEHHEMWKGAIVRDLRDFWNGCVKEKKLLEIYKETKKDAILSKYKKGYDGYREPQSNDNDRECVEQGRSVQSD